MYGLNLLSSFNKSFAVNFRTVVLSFKNIQRNACKLKTSFDLRPQVERDVVLFNFEKPKFFVVINVFSALQCTFWSYLGSLLFISSLDQTVPDLNSQKKFLSKIFDIDQKGSSILGAISIFFGVSMFCITYFYSLRSIRKIILHKGGRDVTIVTFGLPGFNTIKMPLIHMSSFGHRTKVKKYIPVKLKNKLFYYLIDTAGEFSNPALFDYTAGLKRNF